MDGYVTDHCEITRDLSELYAALMFFEENLDRRCKMFKRRLDLLIPVCDEISEQYYLTIKRQLLFNIGSIYSEMTDAKIEILTEKQSNKSLTQNEASKIHFFIY
jgi:KIF-binding protein